MWQLVRGAGLMSAPRLSPPARSPPLGRPGSPPDGPLAPESPARPGLPPRNPPSPAAHRSRHAPPLPGRVTGRQKTPLTCGFKSSQVHPWRGHQGREPRHEIQRLQHDVHGAIAVRGLLPGIPEPQLSAPAHYEAPRPLTPTQSSPAPSSNCISWQSHTAVGILPSG